MSASPPGQGPPVHALALPSGRLVRVSVGPDERVEIIGATGEIELSVELGPHGPVMRLHAARLELCADTLALTGRRVEITASELASIQSGGEATVQAPLIRLN